MLKTGKFLKNMFFFFKKKNVLALGRIGTKFSTAVRVYVDLSGYRNRGVRAVRLQVQLQVTTGTAWGTAWRTGHCCHGWLARAAYASHGSIGRTY
eukprot:SAG31_NODE_30305_length_383_cov_0.605634_1_plen_95_part_00